MTIQTSILAGAVIIGMAIIGSQFAAPYQVTSGPALVWRINTVTGSVTACVMNGANRC